MFALLLVLLIIFIFALTRRPLAGTAFTPAIRNRGVIAPAGQNHRQLATDRGIERIYTMTCLVSSVVRSPSQAIP